ncbi:long-chain-fatty-acid--CoA ligase [Alkalihalobacterium chitinilyticum]|uniref:Long-chain fatty acid--CoA ligase n=1 Tax=Alkalihalobacterium chitinilyticum TaxID=2980103 RepID=A0ABT5VEJ6_9BACI|nr:long-chain fatty acid--CoA ligase [Alkalihalobacterium chitinilyticum]MDE5413871.1 long-chain fatty acid--CoA ligase [Alkalihalobacterium chitinilyticum]
MSKSWLPLYHENISEQSNIEERSLTNLFEETVKKYPQNTALTFYHLTWTYEKTYAIVEKLASALAASGMKKGDRLAIMLPNCPQYVFSLFATFRVGGIVVQVNPMYVERELEYILKDSDAEYMVILADLYPRLNNVRKKTSLKKAIVVGLQPGVEVDLQGDDILFDDYVAESHPPAPTVTIDPADDIAVLQYTGGTTGVSKGVMLTHLNFISNIEQTYDFMYKVLDEFPNNAKVVNVLPMFHIFSLTCVNFLCVRHGGNQILLPRFEMQEVLETIKKEQPFQFAGVPTMYVGFNAVGQYDVFGLDQIKSYVSGGSSLPVEALEQFEKGTNTQICEGFGLSEASPVTHFNPSFRERKAGSIGIPLPSTDAKVVRVTENGFEEAPVGEVGELIIKGPQVMKGYWKKPEATAETIKDGWLYTGDLARMDEDGYFYIVDRKKDMIIASGYNIYPREIEEVLYQHPDVQEVIVLGIPDPYRGETVKAYVTLKGGSPLTEEELIKFSQSYLAAYKVPKFIEFRDELPKSAVGKLLKRKLRDEELEKIKAPK